VVDNICKCGCARRSGVPLENAETHGVAGGGCEGLLSGDGVELLMRSTSAAVAIVIDDVSGDLLAEAGRSGVRARGAS